MPLRLIAILVAVAAAGVAIVFAVAGGGDEARPVSVADVLERPTDRGLVSVTGTAAPVGPSSFVVSGGGRSIWALAPAEAVKDLAPLERVSVRAEVKRLTDREAVELADHVAEADPAEQPGGSAVLRARRTGGAPYLRVREISRP